MDNNEAVLNGTAMAFSYPHTEFGVRRSMRVGVRSATNYEMPCHSYYGRIYQLMKSCLYRLIMVCILMDTQ